MSLVFALLTTWPHRRYLTGVSTVYIAELKFAESKAAEVVEFLSLPVVPPGSSGDLPHSGSLPFKAHCVLCQTCFPA